MDTAYIPHECIICMNELNHLLPVSSEGLSCSEAPEIAHLNSCPHMFHLSCLSEWLMVTNTCPLCRQVFQRVDVSKVVHGTVEYFFPVGDMPKPDVSSIRQHQRCHQCGRLIREQEDDVLICEECEHTYHIQCLENNVDVDPLNWFCPPCTCMGAAQRRAERQADEAAQIQAYNLLQHRHSQPEPLTRGPAFSRLEREHWQIMRDRALARVLLLEDLEETEEDTASSRQLRRQREQERRIWEARVQASERNMGRSFYRTAPPAPAESPLLKTAEEEAQDNAWKLFEEAKRETEQPPTGKRRIRDQSPPRTTEPCRKFKKPRCRERSSIRVLPNSSTLEGLTQSSTAERISVDGPKGFLQLLVEEMQTPAHSDLSSDASNFPISLSISPPISLSPVSDQPSPGSDRTPFTPPFTSPRSRSPPSTIPYETKCMVHEVVSSALKPFYQTLLTKEKFAELNQGICRRLYREVEADADLALEDRVHDEVHYEIMQIRNGS